MRKYTDRFFFAVLSYCIVTGFLLIAQPVIYAQPRFPVPAFDDNAGFVSIFDGKTLHGWDGDPVYWRVENGILTGEITPETIVERNSFIIWQGGKPADFELKLEYRISAEGNSGLQYRSVEVPDVPWALKGYQADIDGRGRWTGINYEERGRTFLALRGQLTRIVPDDKPQLIGTIGDADELNAFVKQDDWNAYHVIARGNMMVHIINGQVMSMVIDDDPQNSTREGYIGVQVHTGPPMKVEFRNIMLKTL